MLTYSLPRKDPNRDLNAAFAWLRKSAQAGFPPAATHFP